MHFYHLVMAELVVYGGIQRNCLHTDRSLENEMAHLSQNLSQ